ncbi:MAG: tetratricopeptide repeat protein [Candidatus Acidiferrales bacterium]
MAEETQARVCPRCGNPLPEGATECPQCDNRLALLLRSRETVLSLCAVILIVFFFLTGMITQSYHQKLDALGSQWFAAGQQQLKANDASAALSDFRNALVYRPDDAQVQFQLAQALSEEGRNEEAQSYLLGLLAHSPSDAPVNLALARIAAHSDSETDTLRYYHGAIYGVWPKDAETNRLNARLELCRFLVGRGDPSSADGELIALESEIPQQHGAPLHEQTGELFLRAGDLNRALEEFQRAMEAPHPPLGAIRGAGLAAYQMGDFHVAERYLDRAHREKRDNAEMDAALETTQLVLAWDPDARDLTDAQRRERVRHDLAQAVSRVQSCAQSAGVDLTEKTATQSNLATLYAQAKAMQPQLVDRNLARHPEQLDAAINLVFALEAAAQKCGQPTGLDKALVVLGTYRQGRER